MARLAVKIPDREEELIRYRRWIHESDGSVEEICRSDFQERVTQAVAMRILKDWDKFVEVKGDYVFVEIKEIELCEPMIR